MDRIRVIRIIVYEGERGWVEDTVAHSLHGTFYPTGQSHSNVIKAATIGDFPEALNEEGTWLQRGVPLTVEREV